MGVTQQMMQRRHAGLKALELDEIDEIEAITGIDALYLLTGLKTEQPPTGGGRQLSLHTESNRGPFHYKRNPSDQPNHLHLVPNSEDMSTASTAA